MVMWALKFLPDYRHLLLFKNILEAQYVEILKMFVVSRETFCVQIQLFLFTKPIGWLLMVMHSYLGRLLLISF